MGPKERKIKVEIAFLCDAGLQETVCFKLGEPKLNWYILYDILYYDRMIYSIPAIGVTL